MNSARILWPDLDEGYTDEFGAIDPEVYQAAGELWPQAEKFVDATTRDGASGLRLMLKAAALVSRKTGREPERIYELKGYIWTTFERLVLGELKKESHHQALGANLTANLPVDGHQSPEAFDDHILLQEIVAQMNAWTRTVFELRALGHEFEEIALMLETPANLLRSRFSKEIKKLRRFNR